MCRRLGVRGLGPALCQGFRWAGVVLVVGTVVGQSRPLSMTFLLPEFRAVGSTAAGVEVACGERGEATDAPDVSTLSAHAGAKAWSAQQSMQ